MKESNIVGLESSKLWLINFSAMIRLLMIVFLFLGETVFSQDTHYWTRQFGTKSALMGGAVIGGIRNNTSLFYNPGALGFIDTNSLSINANAYQSENIKLENALGQAKDFKSNHIAAVPLLVGGMFQSKKEKRLKIAYGVVTSMSFDFNANARIDGYETVTNDAESPGDEEFIAQSTISSSIKETIAGIGIGRKLNDQWSVGISGFFIVRTQTFNRSQYARLFLNDANNTLVNTSFVRNVHFYNVRFAPKLGISYEKEKLSLGFTVSPPSLNLFGTGDIAIDLIGNNVPLVNGRGDFLGNDRQEKLKSKFKSPFSVSAGANYSFSRSAIGIAAQYWGEISPYDVMRAKPSAFVRPAALNQELSSDQFLRLKSGAKAVFNIGVGYEYNLKESLSLIASLRTDQSFYDTRVKESLGIKSEITTWNIYHFTSGVIISKGKSQLSIGLLLSFGSDKARQEDGNLDNPSEDNFLQGSTTVVKANYSSFGLLVGYSFSFKKF